MSSRIIKLTLSFFAALLISSVCGTQYLFSAYSTTLAERLDFSSVQINTIGSAANYGVYLGKPLFGYIADNSRGRRPFFAAFVIFIGYFCLAMTYEGNLKRSFLLCIFYVFIAGIASSAGLVSSLVTLANNFTSFRGVTLGAPLALSGLSAAIYSEINTLWFDDDTYHFLLFLAVSSGLCIFIGSWFLVVVPPPGNHDTVVAYNEPGVSSSSSNRTSRSSEITDDDKSEITPLLQNNAEEIDIGGWDLLYNSDFQILAISAFLLAGTGLMYINNVGTIVKSLYYTSSTTSSKISKLQNTHVFYLSVFSCLGRSTVGFLSDVAKLLFKLSRLWFFIISGIWLLIAQMLILFYVDSADKLMIVTMLVGFGFGNLYAIIPAIVNEWFGTKRFGTNWGIIACIPAFGGQMFNLIFGFNYDLHKKNHCSGKDCYGSVFYLSLYSCLFSIFVTSSLLYIKSRKKII